MGRAIAQELESYDVCIVATYMTSLESAKDIGIPVCANLSKEEDVARVIKTAIENFGRIDALVHMAAPYERTEWKKLDFGAWVKNMSAIADSAFLMAKMAGDEMLTNEEDDNGIKGKMVFVSDWAVQRPYPDYLPYLTAKEAVEGLVKNLAINLAPCILVNGIRLGPMIKPPNLSLQEENEVMAHTPLKRWGGPGPVAQAVRFILEADFMTGSFISVDGGRSIG